MAELRVRFHNPGVILPWTECNREHAISAGVEEEPESLVALEEVMAAALQEPGEHPVGLP